MAKTAKQVPAEAIQVLQAFLDANRRGDKEAAKACLSRASLDSGQWESLPPPEKIRFVFGESRPEGPQWIIDVEGVPEVPGEGPPATTLPCVMVREGDAWKFDLDESLQRVMSGLEEAMSQAATAMAKTMEAIGETMAKGLSEAFGGESASAEAPGATSSAPAAEEFLPLPEMTPLPKTQAAFSKAVGSPVIAQAAIQELLQRAGSNDRKTLLNWFEGQLFAGWAKMLAGVGKTMPLKNRLRAFRIEVAPRPEHRMLALDGNDLVYRMLLPYNEGFFQDDQVEAMLPGVLAGLPGRIDPTLAGHRLLPTPEEPVDLDYYRQNIAPRWMQRIDDLLGMPVTLEADWSALGRFPEVGCVLAIWGLNRVWGAIALACQSPARRQLLVEQLSVVKIVAAGLDSDRCYARYDNGTLEYGVKTGFGSWEIGCYEHEIAQTLPVAVETPRDKAPKKGRTPRKK